jgi:hypothetical protein
LNILIYLLTVELEIAESRKVICNSAVIFLFPHPLIKKYLTMNLCSTSSMTGSQRGVMCRGHIVIHCKNMFDISDVYGKRRSSQDLFYRLY